MTFRQEMLLAWVLVLGCAACKSGRTEQTPRASHCLLVSKGFGPPGTVKVRAETLASGLEVPWGIAFLPDGDMLVTERPGRLRRIHDGKLVEAPVARIPVAATAEAGLLGIAIDPDFSSHRLFYLYATVEQDGRRENRITRWRLSEDGASATLDKVIFAGIAAAPYHDGGRLRFGPDRMLYAGTGDATDPQLSQQPDSPNGKVLRLTTTGAVPADNPLPGNPLYVLGVRNVQAFDWMDDGTLVLADHGPSGERGRTGHDEINVAPAGANLGWPDIYSCEARPGMVAPRLTWDLAVPPGGASFYRGEHIPEWKGSLLVGALGARHLHRVTFSPQAPHRLLSHEVYFSGDPPEGLGRLRDVVMGPDGHLYVSTSNCDGRGSCPPEKDRIVRILPATSR